MSDLLPGTQPLTTDGDLAARMVAGIDAWLARATVESRSSGTSRLSVDERRRRLSEILGVVDPREPPHMEYVARVDEPDWASGIVGQGDGYRIHAVRWSVFTNVTGEGLLLLPEEPPTADVIAIPDCAWTPEMLTGLTPGVAPEAQYARRLAENGSRVLVPVLLNCETTWSGHPAVRTGVMSHREFVYRAAFELGRHVIGYELQKVLAAVDHLAIEGPQQVGVIGYGEGGLLALYAGALDPRISAVAVSGYFRCRDALFEEPIDRNVWRLLAEFGDAEIAALIAPRPFVVEAVGQPEVDVPSNLPELRGPTPGRITTPPLTEVEAEVGRLRDLAPESVVTVVGDGDGLPGSEAALGAFLDGLIGGDGLLPAGSLPARCGRPVDVDARQRRQVGQLVGLNEHHLVEAEFRRADYWSEADDTDLDRFVASGAEYRRRLSQDVIGELPEPNQPLNPRSRLFCDEPGVRGYEVMLDVYPGVFAYGILLLPTDISPGQRRPVVVAQHGLEGTPRKAASPRLPDEAYHRFGYRLAERGFVVFAPQNPYIGGDAFRQLQRRANPLGLSLFSFITRQHQRILEWLAAQPFVDPERIAFYGISYGGKTAMRVPALLDGYCLSICSADYDEWIWKCASSRHRYSYLYTGEYEMSEWNLGNTFNHAEMSWLILPRPFMVERGHHDGVASDEWVFYEYAKSFRRYDLLGVGERCEIEIFDGPHTISGKGTFDFLHRWLDWPDPDEWGG